jgi:type II secretory pathway component PulJ
MMMIAKKIFALFLLLIPAVICSAQNEKADMADTMRSNGKIYVVVAVMLTILAGLILYVVRIDRKLKKLEKEQFN